MGNERTSRSLTIVIATASALIPLFLVMATQWFPFFLGKVMPVVLASVAALLTAVLTSMRPLERWRLYRTYERILEAERFRYLHGIKPYNDKQGNERDAAFLDALARYHLKLHDKWEGLVPRSEDAAAEVQPKKS